MRKNHSSTSFYLLLFFFFIIFFFFFILFFFFYICVQLIIAMKNALFYIIHISYPPNKALNEAYLLFILWRLMFYMI